MIALLIVSIALTISPLSIGPASASPNSYEIIVQGKGDAYSLDYDEYPPGLLYEAGDYPPIMAAKRVDNGAVVAAGFAASCRNGNWNDYNNPDNHLDDLLHYAFQWMVPGAENVLWYEGYNVYNGTTQCSDLIAALTQKGPYFIVGDNTTPITPILLEPYDILVIPQLELGAPGTGGDPNLLPDNDVETIEDFVRAGGGLLIMEGGDTLGYNYCKVQNKILRSLDMNIYFQSDTVEDDVNNWEENWEITADIDNTTNIGSAYQNLTGKTEIGLYSVCSLQSKYAVLISISPKHRDGFPGGMLSFTVNVRNIGSYDDNYTLIVSENVWRAELSENRLENVQPCSGWRQVTLSVIIPENALLCTEDDIVITAISQAENAVSDNANCIAHAAKRVSPTTEDSTTKGGAGLENTTWGWDYIIAGRYLDGPSWGWLKFDLRAIPSLDNIARANLYLYCHDISDLGAVVRCHCVDNDDWSEATINWSNKPPIGGVLDTRSVYEGGRWYSWDVTDFVREQFALDNKASLCLVDLGENVTPDHYALMESKEFDNVSLWSYLEIENQTPARDVRVYVEPVFKGGSVGWTENYIVTVVNKGTQDDTYTLENVDNSGWQLSLDNASLFVRAGENKQTTLHVQIPSGSVGTLDTITVKATGTEVSDSAGCFAYRGKAVIPGLGRVIVGGLYCAQVDVNFLVSSELVVKFYDYYGSYESENVFWSGAGIQVAENYLAVGHPPVGSLPVRKALKKAELALRSGVSERVLSSFTVHQSHLRERTKRILFFWGSYPWLQPDFRAEDKDILIQWGSAPP